MTPKKTKWIKRIGNLFLLLCLCMVLSSPVSVFAESGTTTVDEAKWGADEDNLTGSGTLVEAIAAANATGSTVKYIRLQKDVTASETYSISGGEFVLDLNSCSVTVSNTVFKINGGKVTFQDSSAAANGKVECTDDSKIAVSVLGGEVTFTGGQYTGHTALNVYKLSNAPTVTIKGGSFTCTVGNAVSQTNSTLTIEGGSFTAGESNSFVVQSQGGSTTIKGGSFTTSDNDHISYSKGTAGQGTLDMSGYPTTPTTGIMAITALRVYIDGSGNSINVGTDIKLPGICSFYRVEDTGQTTVTTLVGGFTYAIKIDTPEAKWGTSKDSLTDSGTLAEAIAAANATGSTIKYILLNKCWTATGTSETIYEIQNTEITFDLNGQTVSAPLCLRAERGSVTFTDSVGGGQWENTVDYAVIISSDATVTFTGGSYKGKSSAVYMSQVSATAVINGGTFIASPKSYAISGEGTLTVNGGAFSGQYGVAAGTSSPSTTIIKGGDFSQCSESAIIHYGGTLDLSAYPTTATAGTTPLTDLTVKNVEASTVVGTAIKLPEGYGFYKSDDTSETIVTELAASTNYAIKSNGIPVAEAKWGTNKSSLTSSGTLADAIAAANATGSTIKYILLNKSWTATGTDVTYYYIKGEGITFDLNGKTVSGPLCLQVESGSVTFTDSVGGGQWENTYSTASAVNIGSDATVTFTGGTYKGSKAVYLSDSNSVAVIESGTFESTGNYAVSVGEQSAQLTIEGGSFTGGKWSSVAANGIVTIKGGSFTAGDRGHIAYWGGTLDLTGYPTTATTGTTALTDLTVSNWTGAAVNDGEAIKLPTDYGFYKSDDTAQTIVTELAVSTTYAIKSAVIHEAKWGTNKDSLTGSGTLAEAIAAANATGSTIKYILLNKSWTVTGISITYYEIKGTGITFDLNGKTVSGPLCLRVNSGSVTFTDSVGGGQWENTASGSSAVDVGKATATFTGGSYKGSEAIYLTKKESIAVIKTGTFESKSLLAVSADNLNAQLTIEGGSFTGSKWASVAANCIVTIKGGSFTAGSLGHIAYFGGTLDLSSYPATATTGTTALTDLTVSNRTSAAVTVGTAIKLPEGYGFYKSDDTSETIVTELAASTNYAIKSNGIPVAEAKWGTDKSSLTGSGTLAEAIVAANATGSTIKYILLNKSWTATGTDVTNYYIKGEGITFDLNGKTVSGSLCLQVESGSVTFTDSAGGGQWENTGSDAYAVIVKEATATFTGGSYKGSYAVCLSGSTSIVVIKGGTFEGTGNNAVSVGEQSAQLTIEGGSFTGGKRASVAANGIVTIKGGTFAAGTMGHIAYWGGTLDLTGYPTTATTGTTALTDLTVSNWTGTAVNDGTTVKLPEGYGFYKSDDTAQTIVTELAASTTYAIKLADIVSVDITWTSMEFTYTDGVWNPETHDYGPGTWTVTGGRVTVKNTGNVTVTASFDYVSESNVTGIVGGFTKRSFDLDENENNTTSLILSGKPSRRLRCDDIGTITVTIAQKNK